jgi:hypothetical protein
VSRRMEMEARDRITGGLACALGAIEDGRTDVDVDWRKSIRAHHECVRLWRQRGNSAGLTRRKQEPETRGTRVRRVVEIAFLGRDDDVPRPTRTQSDVSSSLVRAQTRAHDGDDIDSDVSATIFFLGGCSLYLRFPACSGCVPRDGYIHSQPSSSSPLKPQNSRPS